MQAPSFIEDFPHSPPSVSNSNFNRFELLMQQQQQQTDKTFAATTSNNTPPLNSSNSQNSSNTTTQRPGVAASFLYKLTELAAYASAIASDTYQTVTAGGKEQEIPETNDGAQYIDDDVMQINADDSDDPDINDDELSDNDVAQSSNNDESNNLKMRNDLDKKSQCSWNSNDDEEPPPPYDISWMMPTGSTPGNSKSAVHNVSGASTPASSPKQIQFNTPQDDSTPQSSPVDSSSATPTSTKRKQIRVRRPRRLLRRKSSSTDLTSQSSRYDDQDAMLLKVNEKLADMISQGKAALISKVDVTEVEIMLAEEKEREERIMKELGLQSSTTRRRRLTGGSSSDCDYFSGSLSDSGSYSAPESSYCDYGYGSGSGYASSNGYNTPHRYSSMHYNTPNQYGYSSPPVGYNLQSHEGYSILGSKFTSEPVQGAPLQNGFHVPQTGGYDHMMQRGCSNNMPSFNGLSSNRFVGAHQNGFNGYVNSSAGNYGPNAGSCGHNVGGFVPNQNSFGANSGPFGPNVGGYGPNVGGYGPGGYGPGFGPNTGGYGPNSNGFMSSNLGGYGPNTNGYTGSKGSSPAPNSNGYGPNVGFGSNDLYNNRDFIY
ncbi:hypothetical protein C2G38_2043315 [Gigaspora rosea]|uniref:Uncharacterized protein n=1 Tax=Gigaspora rosea TaxID=44941 RepID=A0A397UPJ1_9GLOM|nr:hypothetical protein C2G38_2043315 [Gigaspora rosea]